jgi:Fe-S cluster assembly protein SufD
MQGTHEGLLQAWRDRDAKQGWTSAGRAAAMERFESLGFPTRRVEAWKYTNTRAIADTPFTAADPASPAPTEAELPPLPELGGPRLVFFNGHFVAGLSRLDDLPDGLEIGSLAERMEEPPKALRARFASCAQTDDHAFASLNTALWTDGAWIHLARGRTLEHPVHLVFVAQAGSDPVVAHPRTLVVAEEASQLCVVEHYLSLGSGTTLTNAVTEIVAGAGANVHRVKLADEGDQAFHVATLAVDQQRDSRLRDHNLSFGARLARNDIHVLLGGEGAEADLQGLYFGLGSQHHDTHSVVDHAVPHCTSNELYKGILGGRAHGVFSGLVTVREDAQKTNAQQSNPNLLLSDTARVDTRPQLVIHADDVKCAHGATVGRLDDAALFYLRSRGIGADEARRMLTVAFGQEIVDGLPHPALRDHLSARFSAALMPVVEA